MYLLFASNVLLQLWISNFMTDWFPGVTASNAPTYSEILVLASAYLRRVEFVHVFGCKFRNCRAVILRSSTSSLHLKWIIIVATSGGLGGNLTISQTGITAKPCWILPIFFFFWWITAEPPEVEPCRIGLAQDKAILCCCHLKLEFKKKKTWELKACSLTSLFTEMPFQG